MSLYGTIMAHTAACTTYIGLSLSVWALPVYTDSASHFGEIVSFLEMRMWWSHSDLYEHCRCILTDSASHFGEISSPTIRDRGFLDIWMWWGHSDSIHNSLLDLWGKLVFAQNLFSIFNLKSLLLSIVFIIYHLWSYHSRMLFWHTYLCSILPDIIWNVIVRCVQPLYDPLIADVDFLH